MPTETSPYARIEYERRFLVPAGEAWRDRLEPFSNSKTFEDKYLPETRLRLRALTESATGRRLWKLTRKEESPSPYYLAMTTLYLTELEHARLDALDGHRLRKVRHYHRHLGRRFSVDAFEGPLQGLVLCETESASLEDLMAAVFPPFARDEVTADPFFTGGNLCRVTAEELRQKLSAWA
jgi:CYTH domain-containing protein